MKYGVEVRNLTKGTEQKKLFDTFEEARNFFEACESCISISGTADKYEVNYIVEK